MLKFMNFVPTKVGPTKLEIVLSWCVKLSDESKQKVCIIQDIAKLGKLLGHPPMSSHNFYTLYEMPIHILEAAQHHAQIEYNTKKYRSSL